MTTRMRLADLIRNVRACKTAAEERAVISKECAQIRTAFKEEDNDYRHRNVAKLLFIHMLGYSTHFGHMECLKLIATSKFGEKRIGYLALMLLLDERQEVLMLVTNSLQTDLKDSNHFVVALALCAMANIGSVEMSSDLAPDIEKLLKSQNPYIRKKACLAGVRIIRKVPELVDNFIDHMPNMINDRNHAVLHTAVTFITEICKQEEFVGFFQQSVGGLVKTLRNLVHSGYTPEHDVSGLTDPFLQVSVLRLLRILGKGDSEASDKMADILAQVVTNTEITKNAGNAIVYECIQTIMSVESESGLRTLAINVLGRFLLNRDNNIRYVALYTLGNVVIADNSSVQRHRGTIVECLKDADISIRHRAQHLVYSLVNDDNVRILVRELVDYLSEAETAMKGELAAKICACVDKFAPNKRYHIDTVIKVLTLAGNEVKFPDTTNNLVALISSTPELFGYATYKMFIAAREDYTLQCLAQITLWTVGEYGEMLVAGRGLPEEDAAPVEVSEDDVLAVIEKLLRMNTSTTATKEYAVTALVKLSARFSQQDRIKRLLSVNERSISLELQQRVCEYVNLVDQTSIRSQVLERMPAIDLEEIARANKRREDYDGSDEDRDYGDDLRGEGLGIPPSGGRREEYDARDRGYDDRDDRRDDRGGGYDDRSGREPEAGLEEDPDAALEEDPDADAGAATGDLLGDLLGDVGASSTPAAPSGGGGSAAASSGMDLLGDLLGGGPAAPAPAAAAVGGSADLLGDLLGGGGAAPAPAPAPVAAAAPSGGFPSIVAYQGKGVQIKFDFSKAPNNAAMTAINATVIKAGSAPDITGFAMQAAVPKYIKLQMLPASGTSLPPNPITQVIRLANSRHGEAPVQVRLKLVWSMQGQQLQEMVNVANLPPGL